MTGLDSLLPAISGVGGLGGLGMLLWLVIHLSRALRADRTSHLEQLQAYRALYLEQLTKKQAEVDAEEKAHEGTQQRLDQWRERARAAEDVAAEMRREVQGLKAEVRKLRAEVERLAGGGA